MDMITLLDITEAGPEERQAFRQVLRDSGITKDAFLWKWQKDDPRVEEVRILWQKVREA